MNRTDQPAGGPTRGSAAPEPTSQEAPAQTRPRTRQQGGKLVADLSAILARRKHGRGNLHLPVD